MLTPPRRSTTGAAPLQSTMVDSMPDDAGTAIQDGVHLIGQVGGDVGRGGRAHPAEAVGRRGRHAGRPTRPAGGEGPQQGAGDGVVGHAQADGGATSGDHVQDGRPPLHQQGDGAGPEGVRQQPRRGGHRRRPLVEGGGIGQVHDQGVVGRPALDGEDPGDAAASLASAPSP